MLALSTHDLVMSDSKRTKPELCNIVDSDDNVIACCRWIFEIHVFIVTSEHLFFAALIKPYFSNKNTIKNIFII